MPASVDGRPASRSSHLILRHDGIQIRLADDKRFPWLLLHTRDGAGKLNFMISMTELRRDIIELATRLGKVMKGIFRLTRSTSPPLAILFRSFTSTLSQGVKMMTHGQDLDLGFRRTRSLDRTFRRARVEAMKDAIEQELPT